MEGEAATVQALPVDALERHVRRGLKRWDLAGSVSVREIVHGGRASRTWLVTSADTRWVAKLIFDRPEFAVPGLAVSEVVAAAGVRTGPPVRTRDGEIATAGPTLNGRPTTLAVLRHERGRPLDPARPGAPELAAGLLATVHGALLDARPAPAVPARLLDWFADVYRNSSNRRGLQALDDLARIEASVALTYGVVYGDPSPEVLVDRRSGDVALIDWGTPSWGPLLHDVATWASFLARGSGRSDDAARFVSTYRKLGRLDPEEYRALPLVDAVRTAR